MDYDDMRHDLCRCGKIIDWDSDWTEAECKHCGTRYKVDCDSVLVYWLVEIMKEQRKPWKTDPQ